MNNNKCGLIPRPVLETEGLTHGSLPLSRELWGALLYVDVSGFTSITEYANAQGHYGIEIITGVLNNYFEQLASLVYAKAGFIAKYGGDSCLAVFPYLADEKVISHLSEEIDALCYRLDQDYRDKYGFGFRVHGGVAFCSFTINIVGDRNFHADYYIHSSVLSDLYRRIEAAHTKGIMPAILALPAELEAAPPQIVAPASPELFLPAAVVSKLDKEEKPAELRNATVLFINVMSLEGELISVHDYHEFFVSVQKWVYEFGGVVNKIDFTEKGYLLIALFGVPLVHPDDVERAFICALRITQISFTKVTCRIGITSSNIYCGVIGSSMRYEYGIIGNAVNIAARLMNQAAPGQIALSEDILPAISSRFKTHFVESARVKGIAEPIKIHLLDSELPEHWAYFDDKFRDLPLYLSDQQQELCESFVTSPQTSVLCVIGHQGSGKSFLIWHLFNQVQHLGRHPDISIIDRKGQNLRLEFFFSLGRRVLGISSFRSEFERLTELANLRNLDWNESIIKRYLFAGMDNSGSLKAEEIDVARDCLIGLCLEMLSGHDILLIDNFDLYDQESKVLFGILALRFMVGGNKIVLSATREDSFQVPEGFDRLVLSLGDISFEQSSMLIKHSLPLITSDAITLLHEISSGNPQFLIGIIQQLKTKFDTKSDLINENTITELRDRGIISTNLENMLMANYESLGATEQKILRLAAVYGSSFSIMELQEAFGIAEQFPIQQTISFLLKELYLELDITGSEPRFDFSNSLLRESIYRSILLGEKRNYHAQIAASLAAAGDPSDEDLQRIVYHYQQAEEINSIAYWSGIAAKRFYNAGAWDFSRKFFQLFCTSSDSHNEVIDARLKMAELCLKQAANAEAKAIMDSLPELQGNQAEQLIYINTMYLNNTADYVALKEYLVSRLSGMNDKFLKSQVHIYYLESFLFSNDLQSFFREAMALYSSLESVPELQNRLAGVIAQAHINQGDYAQAKEFYSQKRMLSDKLGDGLGMRIALSGMGVASYRMGAKAEAWEFYQAALKVAEQTGNRNGYSKVLLDMGVFLKSEMRFDEAWDCYTKAMLLAKKMGNLLLESILIYDMGEMLYMQEKYEEALPLFMESWELAKRIHDYSGVSFCNDALGDCYFRKGDYALAEQTYLGNIELQKKINDREGMAHSWGNLGNCAKVRREYSEARKYYNMQYKLLLKVQDWDGAGRSRFNLAMIHKERGFHKRALHQLDNAIALFTRCQAEHYLQISQIQRRELIKLINKG